MSMKRLSLIILMLIPLLGISQAIPGCGTFVNHAPITAASNTTYSGYIIDLAGSATVGINIPANTHDIHITKCIIKNSTALNGLIYIGQGCYNITVDTCFVESGWRGINVVKATNNIHIWYNYFHNINDPNVTSNSTDGGGSSVQLNNCSGSSIQVLDNKSYHDVSSSGIGDQYSVYQSNGTSASPIRVCRNQALNGSTNPPATGYVGAVGGDVGGSYQRIDSNTFVNVGSVLCQIQGGHDIEMSYNTGFLAQSSISSVGMAFGNYYVVNGVRQPCYNITMAYNNVRCIQANGNVFNYWFDPNNAFAPTGWATNTTSTALSASILPNPLWPACSPTVTPPNISYSGSPYTFTVGTAISSLVPSNSGGNVVSYSVSPALPSGLGISSVSGIVSGTPATATAQATYTVTASNSAGQSSFPLVMTVNPIPVVKPSISYSPNSISPTVNTAISTLSASNTGGAVDTWSVSPTPPTGITFNSGTFSGTPTVVQTAQTYTVTASNSSGSSNAGVTITVLPVKPSISYSGSPYTFTQGSAIVPLNPTNTGGQITGFSVSPALPSGLSLNTISGQVSGTPTATQSAATYSITATNAGGTSTFPISIQVQAPAVAAPIISYSPSSQTGTINVAITNMNPINSGGAATGFTISPPLPASLNFNTSNGVISGTGTVVSGSTSYTIVGSNTGGSSTTHVTLQINPIPAPSITYASSSVLYLTNQAITPLSPTNTGGSGVTYTTDVALPAGLTIDATSGVISGVPTRVTAPVTVTIKGTNSTGFSTFPIQFAVNPQPVNHWYLINNSFFGPIFY
jgi:hypothetical protein